MKGSILCARGELFRAGDEGVPTFLTPRDDEEWADAVRTGHRVRGDIKNWRLQPTLWVTVTPW